jgi:hypothetical protein
VQRTTSSVALVWSVDSAGNRNAVLADHETHDVLPVGTFGEDWWWCRIERTPDTDLNSRAGDFSAMTSLDIWPDIDAGYHSVAVGLSPEVGAIGHLPAFVVSGIGRLEGAQIISGHGSDISAFVTRGTRPGKSGAIYILIGSGRALGQIRSTL